MLTETIIQEDVEKNVLESIFSTKLNCFQTYNGKNNQVLSQKYSKYLHLNIKLVFKNNNYKAKSKLTIETKRRFRNTFS